jgi:hypothetical protein
MNSDTEVDRREREANEECPCAHLKSDHSRCCGGGRCNWSGRNVASETICSWPGHAAIKSLADLARKYERRLAVEEPSAWPWV